MKIPHPDNTRLRSLFEMLKTEVWHLVNHTKAFLDLKTFLVRRLAKDSDGMIKDFRGSLFKQDDQESFKSVIDALQPWLSQMKLTASIDRMIRLREEIERKLEDPEGDVRSRDVIDQIDTFLEVFEDELKRRHFLSLSADEGELYGTQYKSFPKTIKSFPSAAWDIIGASRCFAVGEGTACVYHCMGYYRPVCMR